MLRPDKREAFTRCNANSSRSALTKNTADREGAVLRCCFLLHIFSSAPIKECKASVRNAECTVEHCCQVAELPMIVEEHLTERLTEVCGDSPTPNSSVALNSLVPASKLTSVAAVRKASSIPEER